MNSLSFSMQQTCSFWQSGRVFPSEVECTRKEILGYFREFLLTIFLNFCLNIIFLHIFLKLCKFGQVFLIVHFTFHLTQFSFRGQQSQAHTNTNSAEQKITKKSSRKMQSAFGRPKSNLLRSIDHRGFAPDLPNQFF